MNSRRCNLRIDLATPRYSNPSANGLTAIVRPRQGRDDLAPVSVVSPTAIHRVPLRGMRNRVSEVAQRSMCDAVVFKTP